MLTRAILYSQPDNLNVSAMSGADACSVSSNCGVLGGGLAGGGGGIDFNRGFLFPTALLSSLTFHFVYLNARRCSPREPKSSL